jgi:hypothetical protein
MIILPSQKIQVFRPQFNIGMKGFFRIKCWRPDDVLHRARIDTGWFPNKILDSGRNNMATENTWLDWCHVGTNNTVPTALDTQLLGFVVATNTIVENVHGAQASEPWFAWRRKTFRYLQGAGHGGNNLQEAGVGWGSSGATIICRALIIDPITQLPTTVTPLADEILDVTYELRYYPPLIDVNGTVTLDGVLYDTITRASEVNSTIWSQNIGVEIGQYSPNNSSWSAYDGNLGLITQAPSGVVAACDNADQYDLAYSNNSYEQVMGSNTGITGWNLGAGIRSIRVQTTAGAYQTQFDSNPGGNTIPKTINQTMAMEWRIGWTEKV